MEVLRGRPGRVHTHTRRWGRSRAIAAEPSEGGDEDSRAQQQQQQLEEEEDSTSAQTVSDSRIVRNGYVLLAVSVLFFVVSMYTLIASKLMPDTGHFVLDAIKHDRYYSFLVPLTLVATLVTVYLNWLSLKFFRHN